jgi:hypothetical protein
LEKGISAAKQSGMICVFLNDDFMRPGTRSKPHHRKGEKVINKKMKFIPVLFLGVNAKETRTRRKREIISFME